VTALDPSSDAAQKGFQRGDIILSVNQRPVGTVAELNSAVAAAKAAGRASVLLNVQRGNRPPTFIPVRLTTK
jgi:serine protease Do